MRAFAGESPTLWRCPLTTVDVAKPAATKSPAGDTKKPPAKHFKRPTWWWVGVVLLVLAIAASFYPGIIQAFQHPEAAIHSPGMEDFFPEPLAWEDTTFQFNRMTLARLIAAVLVSVLFIVATARLKMRPGRGQLALEYVAEFIRNGIGIELLGTRRGNRYATLLGFIFFGTLAMNLTGVLPGVNIAASSVISVPLVFAVISYVTFVSAGIKARGFLGFFHEQLFPHGTPWPVYFLLTPIIVRPATLAIRLLANMISGHMLLALTYFGTQTLMLATAAMKPIAGLTFVSAIIVTLFEAFVGVLQAYVFTILTAVYIKMSVEAH